MGLFDFLKRKPMDINGSIDEQMRKEAEAKIKTVRKQHNISSSSKGTFVMIIEDVFTITGRGTVVTGRVESGSVRLNDVVRIEQTGKDVVVSGIEMFRKTADYAQEGDNVGILLKEISRNEVTRGTRLIK